MRSITLRLVVAILTFIAGLTVTRLFNTQSRIETTSQAYRASYTLVGGGDSQEIVPNCWRIGSRIHSALASEIAFNATSGMGEFSQKIVLRRGRSKRFEDASVTATYSYTNDEWRGKLAARYYNNLLTVIEEQGYFCMKNEYTTGGIDSPFIVMSVSVGDQCKVIKASGEVPIQLRSICEAIDRMRRKVRWWRAAVKPQPNQGSERTCSNEVFY